jgi:Family of unknown function (DUF5681)
VTDDSADNTGPKTAKRKTRGKPFQAGEPSANPHGRPKGSRNKTTIACEALLTGEAEAIVRKGIELAKAGDVSMIRALLGYILPPKPERHISFTMPPIESASDALIVSKAVVAGVAAGVISPAEGGDLSKMLETHIKLYEVVDLETRLAQLEAMRGIH